MIDLEGAVVCVTGGARGIGRATAVALAAKGATVWIGDLDADEAARTARVIGVKAMPLDVTDTASVAEFHRAASIDGPVAMLVNAMTDTIRAAFRSRSDCTQLAGTSTGRGADSV